MGLQCGEAVWRNPMTDILDFVQQTQHYPASNCADSEIFARFADTLPFYQKAGEINASYADDASMPMKRFISLRSTTTLRPMRRTWRRLLLTARSKVLSPMRASRQASSRVRRTSSLAGSGTSLGRVLLTAALTAASRVCTCEYYSLWNFSVQVRTMTMCTRSIPNWGKSFQASGNQPGCRRKNWRSGHLFIGLTSAKLSAG
jgi:hypothetical protein